MVAVIWESMLRGWRWLSVGVAIGLPVAAAVVLVPLRGHANPAHVALVLTVVVVAVAARGRRLEALVGAGAAAVAFNVVHTEPYGSLRMARWRDVVTAVMLFGVAAAIGELAVRARRAQVRADQLGADVTRLRDVAGLVASGAPPVLVVVGVHRALKSLLGARECRFDPGAWWLEERSPARLVTDAVVVVADEPWDVERVGLPDCPLDLVVRFRGNLVGRYVTDPAPGAVVSRERRLAAVALADQAGAALVVAMSGPRPPPDDPVAPAAAPAPDLYTARTEELTRDEPTGGVELAVETLGDLSAGGAATARRRHAALVVALLGLVVPMVTAWALIPTRGQIDNTNVALVMVMTVVAAGATGRRSAALLATASATASFDFVHTRPYYAFSIRSPNDVVTAVLLLAVGIAAAEIVLRARRYHATGDERGEHIERIHRLAELVALGEDAEFVVIAAAQELRDLLGLHDVRFERGPRRHPPPAELARTGEVQIALDQVALHMTGPPTEIALPVTCGRHEWGRFVLSPLACMSAPLELRLVAVALADQVGAALAEAASHPP